MRHLPRALLGALLLLLCAALPSAAQSFEGVFTGESDEGPVRFELRQTGADVTGSMVIGQHHMTLAARLEDGKVYGIAELEGAHVRFGVLLTLNAETLVCGMALVKADGELDPESKAMLRLTRVSAAPSMPSAGTASSGKESTAGSRGNAGVGARSATINASTMRVLAERVRSNFKPRGADTVLAAGDPPLTVASLQSFAELMRLTFGVELTESEVCITREQFVTYYEKGDAQTKQMLAQGWQSILAQIRAANGAERERSIQEVRDVFADRFAKGAKAGVPWYVAMNATIERRHQEVAQVSAPMPAYAEKAQLKRDLSEADLDASLEMLYFMWVACGRDASLVTPEAVAYVRGAIVQNFALFPPDVQLMFANAQQVYAELRGQWAQATPEQRVQLAYGFSAALDALGLGVPAAGGGDGGGSAWSDVSTQSHGDWAASMVQGLAGSSYKSSW